MSEPLVPKQKLAEHFHPASLEDLYKFGFTPYPPNDEFICIPEKGMLCLIYQNEGLEQIEMHLFIQRSPEIFMRDIFIPYYYTRLPANHKDAFDVAATLIMSINKFKAEHPLSTLIKLS